MIYLSYFYLVYKMYASFPNHQKVINVQTLWSSCILMWEYIHNNHLAFFSSMWLEGSSVSQLSWCIGLHGGSRHGGDVCTRGCRVWAEPDLGPDLRLHPGLHLARGDGQTDHHIGQVFGTVSQGQVRSHLRAVEHGADLLGGGHLRLAGQHLLRDKQLCRRDRCHYAHTGAGKRFVCGKLDIPGFRCSALQILQ